MPPQSLHPSDPATQELLKAMTAKQNFLFTFGISIDPMDGTPIAASHIVIDDFISKPGPVRVLYRDAPVVPSGVHPSVHAAKVGPVTYSGDTWSGNASWYLFRVFVIVDASQLKGVMLGQLADYAALVGLTEIRPVDSLADAPTILQLFNGTPQDAPAGVTEWDRAFLKSLYTVSQHTPRSAAMACRAGHGKGNRALMMRVILRRLRAHHDPPLLRCSVCPVWVDQRERSAHRANEAKVAGHPRGRRRDNGLPYWIRGGGCPPTLRRPIRSR